jgi:hypothetical protein
VIAYTNPSRGLYLSKRFHIIDEGWSPYICVMNSTLNVKVNYTHKKHQFLLGEYFRLRNHCSALILALYGPAISSTALKDSCTLLSHVLLSSRF